MTRVGLAALALLLTGPALAADPPTPDAHRQGFELNLGAGPLLYPAYPGARISRVLPFPYIAGGWGERVEFDLLDGLRIAALSAGGFSAGPAARLRFGRTTADDRAQLQGLRRFPDTVELGGYAAYEAGPLYLDLTGTQDVARAHGGAVLDGRALIGARLGAVAVQAGPALRAVTRAFDAAYYGISANRAAASGRPVYAAQGGLERAGALFNAEWRLSERLVLHGFVEYDRLLGSAARSPLVQGKGGTADQVYAGMFLSWRLD